MRSSIGWSRPPTAAASTCRVLQFAEGQVFRMVSADPARCSCSSGRKGTWPGRSFCEARATANQPARSASGNSACLPDFGGHSIVRVLLRIALGSQSPSTAHACMTLPLGCLCGVSSRNGPSTVKPVSSVNSRRAASIGSSPSSNSPFGIDQAPLSLLLQYGPPGWTRKTSSPVLPKRYSRIPALCFLAICASPCSTIISLKADGRVLSSQRTRCWIR